MSEIKLYNDDCFNVFPQIADKSVDMILCDLPYGTTRNKWDSVLPFDKLWEEYERVIKDDGAIVLFSDGMFEAELMVSNKKLWRYNLVWKKGERTSGFLNANRMPLRNHETICVFYKKLPVYNPQFTEGRPLHGKGTKIFSEENSFVNNNYGDYKPTDDKRKGETRKYPKSVLNFERPHPPIHPTQKPVDLLEWLVRTYTNEGMTVLDNCMGVGSTGIACKNLNRNFIGIEITERYYKIAEQSLMG